MPDHDALEVAWFKQGEIDPEDQKLREAPVTAEDRARFSLTPGTVPAAPVSRERKRPRPRRRRGIWGWIKARFSRR